MALSLLPIHDEIIAKLEELPQSVYITSIPDESVLDYDANGMLLPFVVATFSSLTQPATERGITGPRQDLGRSYALIECVGPNERSTRQVMDLVVNKLTGFQPTDAGYMSPEGVGKPYATYDSNARPVKYVAEIVFGFAVNTVVS